MRRRTFAAGLALPFIALWAGGTTITGGTTRRIAKGDVVVMLGYLPHWWSEVESDMSYLVIRPDPDNTLPLK